MTRKNTIAIISMLVISVMLSLITTNMYGKVYSHSRYWDGTIKRVTDSRVKFIKAIVNEFNHAKVFPEQKSRLDELFKAFEGFIFVEIKGEGSVLWSNLEKHDYDRDAILSEINLYDGRVISIWAFKPPLWKDKFVGWLQHPSEWREDKYDFITFNFFSYVILYFLFLLCLALSIKSKYLEKDVLQVFRSLEERNKK